MGLEYMYNNGDVSINIVEDDYISIEFFPYSQTKEGFESAEFDNVFSIKTIEEDKSTLYDWNIPSDLTVEEFKEITDLAKNFIKESKHD